MCRYFYCYCCEFTVCCCCGFFFAESKDQPFTCCHHLLQSQQIFADSTCCNYPIEKCRLRSRPDTPILSAVASNTGTEKRWPLLVLNQRHKTRSQALYSWAITCLCEYDELHNVMLCLSATCGTVLGLHLTKHADHTSCGTDQMLLTHPPCLDSWTLMNCRIIVSPP